jgi:alpha-glucosidase
MYSTKWWRNAAIYQVYPRSFQDSNGDGEGDLRGVISRLDYLKELGIDAIWLSPFYRTPNRDGGYDVADPRDVDPRFGVMSDIEELIRKSHARDLRIIVDIVPNHFSTEHLWFQAALSSPPGSPARARFHFYDGRGHSGEIPPNNWNSIFGGPAWTRVMEKDGKLGQWYLHLFDSTQADLNWKNEEVHRDFQETLKFWLDKGVDGFRIDVAHGLAKDEILKDHHNPEGLTRALRLDVSDMSRDERESLLSDVPFFDREGVHEIYRKWRRILDSYGDDRMSVAEAWVHPSSRATRYVRHDELHQIFNFDFLIAEWSADFLKKAIDKTLNEVSEVGAPPTWVLSNHDSPRLVTRLGGGELGARKAGAMALLTHALPGGIYIFQGEELGLEDAAIPDSARQDPVFFRTKGIDKGRDGARIPIPWNNKASCGFTTAQPWLPMPDSWREISVEVQQRDDASFLSLYKRSLEIRSHHPALKPSDLQNVSKAITWLPSANGVLIFRREPNFVLVANTTDESHVITIAGELLLASSNDVTLERGTLKIASNSTCWINATD